MFVCCITRTDSISNTLTHTHTHTLSNMLAHKRQRVFLRYHAKQQAKASFRAAFDQQLAAQTSEPTTTPRQCFALVKKFNFFFTKQEDGARAAQLCKLITSSVARKTEGSYMMLATVGGWFFFFFGEIGKGVWFIWRQVKKRFRYFLFGCVFWNEK